MAEWDDVDDMDMDEGPRPSRGRRDQRRDGQPRRRGGGHWFGARRKSCLFCEEKTVHIDYKRTDLPMFLTDRGKIRARRQTGTCARHQRQLATAIKRARYLALVPFVVEPGRPR